jgi:hypothetical protein
MACPCFKPLRRLDSGGWNPAPRLPLGDPWAGMCTAVDAWEPPESTQRDICNHGYARRRCHRFPETEAADAVRFSMSAGERLIYILEKDHAPIEHGEINAVVHSREPLISLARAFEESYNRLASVAAAAAASTAL